MFAKSRFLIVIFLLLWHSGSWAIPEARAKGPFYASENSKTPYLQLGDLLTHFQVFTVDTAEVKQIWRKIKNEYIKLDFTQYPTEPSHSVGENWYRWKIPADKTVILTWTYAGNRRPRWLAVRLIEDELHTASSLTKRWQMIKPQRSRYENWQVHEVQVEIEILNPATDSQLMLYRFRLTSDQILRVAAPQPSEKE